MRITKSELRKIISEEVQRVFETEIEEGLLDPVKKMFGMRTTAKVWPTTAQAAYRFWPNEGDKIYTSPATIDIHVLRSIKDRRLKLKLDIDNSYGKKKVDAVLDTYPVGGGAFRSDLVVKQPGLFEWYVRNIDMNSAHMIAHIADIIKIIDNFKSTPDGTLFGAAGPGDPGNCVERYSFTTQESLDAAIQNLSSNDNLNGDGGGALTRKALC